MPDARILVGVNVEHILSSQIGKELSSQLQSRVPDLQQMLDKTGFDPTRDIQEILIAATGKGQNGPALFLVRGSFDTAKVSAAVASTGRTPQTFEGVQILDNPSQSKGAFAFLDGSIAVGGDLDQVKAAIRRRKQPTTLGAELLSETASLRDRYDIWLVSTAPVNEMVDDTAGTQVKQITDLAKSIHHASGGVKFTADLELGADLTTFNPKQAAQLRDTLQLFTGFVTASSQNPSGLDPKALKLNAEGKTLHISVLVTGEQLKKAYQAQMARAAQTQAKPVAAVRQPVPEETGLTIQSSERDMGTVVLPYTKP